LVTGGAGFIGSHLVRQLLKEDYNVVVLDNFCFGKIENIRDCLNDERFEVIKGDVRNKKFVSKALENVEAVVHLAALVNVEESVNNPLETRKVNVSGIVNLLHEAVKKGIDKFVFGSSAAVYGEDGRLLLKEDGSLKPVSPYAASKAAAENYCRAFQSSYGFPTVILRYFNVYGFRRDLDSYSGVITTFLNNALNDKPLVIFGDGEQTRDFIYVKDVVNATVLALENNRSNGEILNVCTGNPTSIRGLAQTLLEITGRNLEVIHDKPRKGDIYLNYGDPTKAEKIIGFRNRIGLKEGLRRIFISMQAAL